MCWHMQNLLTKNVLGLGTHVLNYTKVKVGDEDHMRFLNRLRFESWQGESEWQPGHKRFDNLHE